VIRLDAAACAQLLQPVTEIAARAALVVRAAIGEGEVRNKADGSPVTAADLAADAAIRAGLTAAAPKVPILSEERAQGPETPTAASYFLVDPLDGTREFIAGRDEYTINIALMTDKSPLLGVIAAPALGLIWRGIVGRGGEHMAFAADGKIMPPRAIRTRPRPQRICVVVVSRSHVDSRTQAYVDALPQARAIACGSALKFCRIAEGSADLYPRLAPTRDWDVAAGHAIVEAAGGQVLAPEGTAVRYGTPELLIPGFIASGAAKDARITG
jgi:3'(2'), 5'-bisphosphate nucleotidase